MLAIYCGQFIVWFWVPIALIEVIKWQEIHFCWCFVMNGWSSILDGCRRILGFLWSSWSRRSRASIVNDSHLGSLKSSSALCIYRIVWWSSFESNGNSPSSNLCRIMPMAHKSIRSSKQVPWTIISGATYSTVPRVSGPAVSLLLIWRERPKSAILTRLMTPFWLVLMRMFSSFKSWWMTPLAWQCIIPFVIAAIT